MAAAVPTGLSHHVAWLGYIFDTGGHPGSSRGCLAGLPSFCGVPAMGHQPVLSIVGLDHHLVVPPASSLSGATFSQLSLCSWSASFHSRKSRTYHCPSPGNNRPMSCCSPVWPPSEGPPGVQLHLPPCQPHLR